MADAPGDVRDFLPLSHLSLQVMLSLAGTRLHGYGIVKEIRARTAGTLDPATGTLYQVVHRLVERGLIELTEPPADAESDDQRRQYYRLTETGREVARAEVARLEEVVRTAQERDLAPADSGRGRR